jgi:hypothetical protein
LSETDSADLLERIQTRKYLEELNHYLLHDEAEFIEAPGKLGLVWVDPLFNVKRYLSVKAADGNQILINGRRHPATEKDLQRGLIACLRDFH